jgi:hypothetical protein
VTSQPYLLVAVVPFDPEGTGAGRHAQLGPLAIVAPEMRAQAGKLLGAAQRVGEPPEGRDRCPIYRDLFPRQPVRKAARIFVPKHDRIVGCSVEERI